MISLTMDKLFFFQNIMARRALYDGLVQDCSISSANALEILQSYTQTLIYASVIWLIIASDNGLSPMWCQAIT